MKYLSTRGNAYAEKSYSAITKGLADDGGLFLPGEIPQLSIEKLCAENLSYTDLAYVVLGAYLSDYGEDTLKECIKGAYSKSFNDKKVTPVVKLDDNNYVLELWHGPTAAFKDVALQLLPHLIVEGKKKLGLEEETLILVATSGDTGKAALEGFKDVKGTSVLCFYPKDGVAPLQEIQMNTQQGKNVHVVSVAGNFDDTQTGVKNIFSDAAHNEKLRQNGKAFSSANSINFGRLCPQIVYYFSAYCQLVQAGEITIGEQIDVVVPTGNFGNILAGWYAKKMGVPIGKLICASNKNNILTEFLNSGTYDANRELYKTVSPSMDILISSNLERLLFEALGRNAGETKNLMEQLKKEGKYSLEADAQKKIRMDFEGGYASEEDTLVAIKEVWDKYNYLVDTHTAVAFSVSEKTPSNGNKRILVSTANPYKFPDSVLKALGSETDTDDFRNIDILESLTGTKAPESLSELRQAKTRHSMTVEKDRMAEAMYKVLER